MGNCTAVNEVLKTVVSQTTVASVIAFTLHPYLVLRMETRTLLCQPLMLFVIVVPRRQSSTKLLRLLTLFVGQANLDFVIIYLSYQAGMGAWLLLFK